MTDLEKSKPKRGWRQRTFPIDFISPLQLEECLYRIEHLPQNDRLKIAVEAAESDSVSFKADMFRGARILVRYRGKMQR